MKKLITLFTLLTLGSIAYSQTSAFEVKVSGKGQPILFLPGFTTPGEVWDETIAHLNKNYETHQFTYAGFGDVPPIEFPWYENISGELIQYMKKQKLKKVILVGHSMGGMLAIDLAAAYPKLIQKTVLVDALPCIREIIMPQVPVDQIAYESPYNLQIINATDSALKVTAGYMAMGMSNQPDVQPKLVKWIMNSDRETYVYGYTDLLKLDLRNKLANIESETLILGADFPSKEAVIPNFESQFANLKNKQITIAENSKHFIMLDQPSWFYDQVNQFLK